MLSRYNYAKIVKISSETIDLVDQDKDRKGVRFSVKLEKTKEFEKLVGDLLK